MIQPNIWNDVELFLRFTKPTFTHICLLCPRSFANHLLKVNTFNPDRNPIINIIPILEKKMYNKRGPVIQAQNLVMGGARISMQAS